MRLLTGLRCCSSLLQHYGKAVRKQYDNLFPNNDSSDLKSSKKHKKDKKRKGKKPKNSYKVSLKLLLSCSKPSILAHRPSSSVVVRIRFGLPARRETSNRPSPSSSAPSQNTSLVPTAKVMETRSSSLRFPTRPRTGIDRSRLTYVRLRRVSLPFSLFPLRRS